MKKILIIAISVLLFPSAAYAAYNVETDDDTYVSDHVYFNPRPLWQKVEAQSINLTEGRVIFRADRKNVPYQINAAVMPINASDKRITYETSDESVAYVDGNGLITPMKKAGDALITLRCGKAMARIKVNVIISVTGVTISQDTLSLYADKPLEAQLTAAVTPSNASVKDIIWTSADESVAYVDKDGIVYPCGVGETEIYAETKDGGFIAKCAVTVSTWEKRAKSIPVVYYDYDITVDEMVDAQMSASPTVFTDNVYPASREEVEDYINPENLTEGYEKYQFMDLGSSNNVDAQTLNNYLSGKGILDGMGADFKKAADDNNLSEVYLVIHACLESGNGYSALANGIEYNGETVYNLFGIGALDSAPVEEGARYAYEQGWTSPEKALKGGAEWISKNYINNPSYGQNTLYKMRWNPEQPAVHQYATDVAWASKQAKDMSGMFEAFPTAEYRFEVPVFKGQEEFEIK